jgi:hypothetical protein
MKPFGANPSASGALLSAKAAKTDDQTIANLIFEARVPRKDVARVYFKLMGHALPADEKLAKAYVRRTLQRARIDEKRRAKRDRAFSWHPQSAVWDKLTLDQIHPDDVERKQTMHALIQTGIALLSPHYRSLVRAWLDRSAKNNVTEIHESLPQSCGFGAYHCKNKAFATLTRIVSGLAVATGNSELRPDDAAKCSGRRPGSRSRQENATAISKNLASARSEGRGGNS